MFTRIKNFFPISVNTYGILFISATIILFGAVALYSSVQIKEIETSTTNGTAYLAKKELSRVILSINEDLQDVAKAFKNWEEVYQQIDNPTFYAYWRKNRMQNASFLPPYFKSAELYDADGQPLSSSKLSIPQITHRISNERIYLSPEKNTIHQVTRIYSDDKNIKGYIILEYHLQKILNSLHLVHIDRSTLLFSSKRPTIPLDELANFVSYKAVENEAFNSLQAVIFSTIFNLSAIAIIIAICLWLMISVFSGRPLKLLNRHIESLGIGEYKKIEQKLSRFLTTREYEKVKSSFNRFQELLKQSESDLKISESRLQTVLENVSIGIITFGEDLVIESSNAESSLQFQYSLEELKGRKLDRLIEFDSLQSFNYLVEKILSNDSDNEEFDSIEINGIRKNGESIELSIDINKVEFEGKNILIAMIRDISQDKRANEKLEHMANYDTLTSLPNRMLFHDRLIHAIEQAHRKQSQIGLMFLDLDRFKMINDTLGHHIGDLLLVQVANRLRECIREGDTVARLGGDEFTVINESIQTTTETLKVAGRINEELRQPFTIEGQQLFISTSIGITFYPSDAEHTDDLIKHADAAMYKAKENGGDGYELYTTEISDSTNQRMQIENKLRHAIDNQEFELVYQPRIDLKSNKITSFEALLRWNDKGHHRATPNEFIPILEDTGMIINAGNWVLNEACIQINHWQNSDLEFNRIAINLSGRQFKHKHFIDDIDSILYTHNIKPHQIEFEITESLLIENIETTTSLLQLLHDRGFHISIDDFGTGYSSLAYLKQFPIDTIKIDQYFLKSYPDDKRDIAIIESIIAMAKNLDMSITAEGIENENQLSFLMSCGCQEAQGYLFAKPMPAATIQSWVNNYYKKPHNQLSVS